MNYLIPANAKRGTLIFGMFNRFDLSLFGIGAIVSIILLLTISPETFSIALLCLSPLFICTFLVVPIPNYHNVLCAIQSILRFYNERRNYIWRGWCFYGEFGSEDKNKK